MTNAAVWFDIFTLDFDRAVKFYSTILGQDIEVREFNGKNLGFFPIQDNGVGGTIVPPGEDLPSSDGTCIYLNVEGRIDEALEKLEPAGGKILNPKVFVPDFGWIAHIIDSEGNRVGLHSSS